MKKENINILNNMRLSISKRKAIIDEMISVLEYKGFQYDEGEYTGYVNLLFILDYISAEDANSLMEEIELSNTYN